jgi:ATP-dependent RNA helicase DDX21
MPSIAAVPEPMAVDDSASKKAKRKQLKAAEAEAAAAAGVSSGKKEKKEKKDKKRKAKEPSSSDESSTSSESEQASKKAKKEKKAKKVQIEEAEEEGNDDGELTASGEDEPAADPNAIDNFRISEPLKLKLRAKGINALFPIQATTFGLLLDGNDLVGRARTGQVR